MRYKQLHRYTGAEAKALRKSMKMNQTEFWGLVGITQSGGCRYERDGRRLHASIQILLNLAFGTPQARGEVLDEIASVRDITMPGDQRS